MPRLRKPRALRPGGTIGIAAPCGPVDPERLRAGEAALRAKGFRIRRHDGLLERRGYLAGDDARRAAELRALVCDPEVDAIVCARGGYGTSRLLDALDPEAFRAARKPLAGFSDVTGLLLWQRRRAGLVGFHAPMVEHASGSGAESFDDLVAQLCGRAPLPRLRGAGHGGGAGEGRLVGGNLALLVASLGTRWEIDTRGAILLFEEVGEKPYRIDRMLQQLRSAGKLSDLAGIGVGSLRGCHDERHPAPDAGSVVLELLRPLGRPLVTGLPFGHDSRNRTWAVGVRATIDGDSGVLQVLEQGVTARGVRGAGPRAGSADRSRGSSRSG